MTSLTDALCLTVRQAAETLGVDESTIYRLTQSRLLGHYRIGPKGKTVRISKDHLRAYLERSECPDQERPANGNSSADQAAPAGTPTGEKTESHNGFRLMRKANRALGRPSRISKPNLKLVP